MGQIKQAFAKMGDGIKAAFYRLKHEFTVRSFFTIVCGLALFVGNAYLFVASTIEMFTADGSRGWLRLVGGLFGFSVSCFLIFFATVYFAAPPQEGVDGARDGSIVSEKTPSDGKKHRWTAVMILLVFVAFIGGGTALGVYIGKEGKYSLCPQTTATVVSLVNNDFDKGYSSAVYEYTVDGKTYTATGKLMSGGEAVPRIGDTVTIKYDPSDPTDIHISTESKFTLGAGCFLLYIGLAVIAGELYKAKKIKTQFLLAFLLLGLTASIFIIYLASVEFHGLITFFARNYMLHFVLVFTNVGILELLNGIIFIGYKK